MNHYHTPLFTALRRHAACKPLQFHIPGHKKGSGMDPEFRTFMGDNVLSIDLINIVPLDDLHQPAGVIREAERLAADAFGADETLFSVQGTTGAIMTMLLSVCAPGDKIILPRNAHKSILSAVIFAGAIPVWVEPEKDERLGIEHGVTLTSIRQAIERNPNVKAVLLINPTYYGTSIDLLRMVKLIHSYDIPVLVDEAHGTLLHFHDRLPMSAMQAGADMAATSVHKLGGSLTQSSVLNVKGNRVNIRRIRSFMSMLTTTSTSYLLLASLDAARRQLALHGQALVEQTIRLAHETRRQINEIPGLYCYGEEICGLAGVYQYDPTKLCIHLEKLPLTGFEAERWLRETYNIEVELSDLTNILCLITIGDTERETARLIQALRHLSQTFRLDDNAVRHIKASVVPAASQFIVTPREAFYMPAEPLKWSQAIGGVCTEFVYVYPPGIPILMPGQRITAEIVDYISRHVAAGLPVKGPEDSTLQEIKVIMEDGRQHETVGPTGG
ncbi:aminotransferase class I/II-fold pyridoxal phosphate-dependent enzyme [Paenibacillus oralis]|uniref:Aminotransferase class I/II-fold pyridoxal phosphate-dependent enzyme n=1 Tax=Paenibacillus oralis TaxID=2490856 RepID=A0A3P3UFY0_9BACL|nr:aminotransferase class I/II-fold pyridoxal phosphate-dependent enzyme [Paenibacillus oralis]RRJ67293.1 aminotransferase class I/II-fold pyridoxal phosphate-dependent enzyme [Paenibacillus oralis]